MPKRKIHPNSLANLTGRKPTDRKRTNVMLSPETIALAQRMGGGGYGSLSDGINAVFAHLAEVDESECPICKKSFTECDYFKQLED